MSLSTRFPVAVHILTILAARPDEFVSASFIARSVATNRVVVSRIMSKLSAAELITSQHGLRGGGKLARPPEDISLLDIYQAVEEQKITSLHEPHPRCPVACAVKTALRVLLGRAEKAFEDSLFEQKLSDVSTPSIAALKTYNKSG